MKNVFVLSVLLIGICVADVSHILDQYSEGEEHLRTTTTTTPPPPPHPYVFSYSAGRYPGHVDRTHSEVSDGSGTVKGAYSYVDPRQQIRTVEYTADENGFHPILSHPQQPPKQSEAVQRATIRHNELYNRIAEEHAHPNENIVASVPKDTYAVAHAKQKHFTLFDKIAQEHSHIAAERELERIQFEMTSSPIEYQHQHQQDDEIHIPEQNKHFDY